MDSDQIALEISDLWTAVTRSHDDIEETRTFLASYQVSTLSSSLADIAGVIDGQGKTILQTLKTIDNLRFHISELGNRLRLVEKNWE